MRTLFSVIAAVLTAAISVPVTFLLIGSAEGYELLPLSSYDGRILLGIASLGAILASVGTIVVLIPCALLARRKGWNFIPFVPIVGLVGGAILAAVGFIEIPIGDEGFYVSPQISFIGAVAGLAGGLAFAATFPRHGKR